MSYCVSNPLWKVVKLVLHISNVLLSMLTSIIFYKIFDFFYFWIQIYLKRTNFYNKYCLHKITKESSSDYDSTLICTNFYSI